MLSSMSSCGTVTPMKEENEDDSESFSCSMVTDYPVFNCLLCISQLTCSDLNSHYLEHHRITDDEIRDTLVSETGNPSGGDELRTKVETIRAIITRLHRESTPSTTELEEEQPAEVDRCYYNNFLRRFRCPVCSFRRPYKSDIVSHFTRDHPLIAGLTPRVIKSERMQLRIHKYVEVEETIREISLPEWEVGALVLAKLRGHPWWPAVILRPPGRLDELYSFYRDNKYHVGFFEKGNKITNSWVCSVKPYDETIVHKLGSKMSSALNFISEIINWTNEDRSLYVGSCFSADRLKTKSKTAKKKKTPVKNNNDEPLRNNLSSSSILTDIPKQKLFKVGEIVLGKLRGNPWWPAVVIRPPGRLDDQYSYVSKRKYHIGFFEENNKISRAWLSVENLKPYDAAERPDENTFAFKCNYRRRLMLAYEWVDYCIDWTDEERSLEYSSIHIKTNKKPAIISLKRKLSDYTSEKLSSSDNISEDYPSESSTPSDFDKILSDFN